LRPVVGEGRTPAGVIGCRLVGACRASAWAVARPRAAGAARPVGRLENRLAAQCRLDVRGYRGRAERRPRCDCARWRSMVAGDSPQGLGSGGEAGL